MHHPTSYLPYQCLQLVFLPGQATPQQWWDARGEFRSQARDTLGSPNAFTNPIVPSPSPLAPPSACQLALPLMYILPSLPLQSEPHLNSPFPHGDHHPYRRNHPPITHKHH